MEKKTRKPNRLKDYDYSQNGAYFITICTKNKKSILSEITVGDDGLTCRFGRCFCRWQRSPLETRTLGVPQIKLSKYGKIVKRTIMALNNKRGICVDNYVIMPNHLHLLLSINNSNGSSGTPTPTVSSFVGLMKRLVNKEAGQNIWQRDFHDHIIRDDYDYMTRYQYIDENPIKWVYDEYYL